MTRLRFKINQNVTLNDQIEKVACKITKVIVIIRRIKLYVPKMILKGLAQAKIIKKSVILFWLPNMTI